MRLFGSQSTQLQLHRNVKIGILAFCLALGWLQPNHYHPWTAFFAEAWIALWFACAGLYLVYARMLPVDWPRSALVIAILPLVGVIQWQLGLIPHFGLVLVHGGYALAAALTLVVAYRYAQEGQGLVDCIFAAIAIMAIGNVGLAIYQYIGMLGTDGLTGIDLWVIYIPPDYRPAGNIAQPNQMTTLLFMAWVAGLWAYTQRVIGMPVLLLYSSFLTLGLALSHSRIAFIQMAALLILLFVKRHLFERFKPLFLSVLFIAAFHMLLFWSIPQISHFLDAGYEGRSLATIGSDSNRALIYATNWTAMLERPWFGYGFSHLGTIQWDLVDTVKYSHAYISRAHNLFFDFVLWFGIPIGISAIAVLLWSFWCMFRRIQTAPQLLMWTIPLFVLLHGMVEFPHQYTQTLLPAMAMWGALAWQTVDKPAWHSPRYLVASVLIMMSLLLLWISRDYLRIETAVRQLRFEEQGLSPKGSHVITDSVPLGYFTDHFKMLRMTARPGVSPEELAWMEQTVRSELSYGSHYIYAVSLALNGRKPEALLWMRRLNAVSPASLQPEMVRVWANYQRWYPDIVGDMPWPSLPSAKQSKQ